MKLKSMITTAVLALAAMQASAAAFVVNMSGPGAGGSYTASFGNSGIGLGNFIDTFDFNPDITGQATSQVSSITIYGKTQDIDFERVDLDGHVFDLGSLIINGEEYDYATLTPPVNVSAPLLLTVKAWSSGNASYSGTINVQPVPEPGTLALMGLGGLGLAFTSRRRAKKFGQ